MLYSVVLVSAAQKSASTVCIHACILAKSPQSCPTMCNPMICSPPGSSVHSILQARILELVVISFSRGSSRPRNQTQVSRVSCIAGGFFTVELWGKPICTHISPLFYFLDFLPIQVTKEHRVEFSVLHSRFPLVICFIHRSVSLSIPVSQFIPALPPLGVHMLVLYTVSLLLLCK